jgi:CxxC motif-containing protein
MKCIICGNNCSYIYDRSDPKLLLIGYKCPTCQLEWTREEHVDDMSYVIQTITALKAEMAELRHQNQILQEAFDVLLRKMKV